MLSDHPELHGRVQFWSFLQPSRQEIRSYRSLIHSIRSVVKGVNTRFGADGWTPIRLELGENIRRAMSAFKNFDVLLVNSIFDGMNLVAKEGTLVNRRDGVLLLSENTGAHEELGEFAITINPFEVDATADALFRALTMGAAERRRRAEGCRAAVRANDITRWINDQLRDFEEVSSSRPSRLAG
jgi:trehalose 6-phosphate synthase